MAETIPRRCLALREIDAERTRSMPTDAVVIGLQPPRACFSLRIAPSLLSNTNSVGGFLLHMPINRHTTSGSRVAKRLGPNEWLLAGRDDETAAIALEVEAALSHLHHSLVDVGHRHVALSVSGRRAADAINCGCPLDLSLAAFAPGCSVRTLLAKAEVILSCQDGTPSFEIECARSYAVYVQDFLLHAARQYAAAV